MWGEMRGQCHSVMAHVSGGGGQASRTAMGVLRDFLVM